MLKKIFHYFRKRKILRSDPAAAIREVGHREYVGGRWDEIGKLQFDFLLSQGLKPHHVFLDIACGSLRGGVHFIRYLDRGHYLGIDKEEALIRAGMDHELGRALYEDKAPEWIVSNQFEFHKFSKIPSFVLAHALFTHLAPHDIELCLSRLRAFVAPGCRFYATFFEVRRAAKNAAASQDHTMFKYPRDAMIRFGEKNRWRARYLGAWHHPRNQMMIEYTAV